MKLMASYSYTVSSVNPFHATGLFRYPLKTSESQRFPDIFRGYRKRPVTWNGLKVFSKLQVLRILGKSIFCLTISWRRPSSYRNQSIDLLCKTMDWFLYDNGLCHERVKFTAKVLASECTISAIIDTAVQRCYIEQLF